MEVFFLFVCMLVVLVVRWIYLRDRIDALESRLSALERESQHRAYAANRAFIDQLPRQEAAPPPAPACPPVPAAPIVQRPAPPTPPPSPPPAPVLEESVHERHPAPLHASRIPYFAFCSPAPFMLPESLPAVPSPPVGP